MLPIFNNYIKFLKDKKCPIDLQEGYYWFDNGCVVCFINNIKYNLCRQTVNHKTLDISWKTYTDNPLWRKTNSLQMSFLTDNVKLESWEDTYRNNEHIINSLIEESIMQTQNIVKKYPLHKIIETTSMGKDSKLTDWILSKSVGGGYELVFNNTTLECADVLLEVKENQNIKILTAKNSDGSNRSFYKMVTTTTTTPSRFNRWCCSYFKEGSTVKEYEGVDNIIWVAGMRNEESETRKNYQWEEFNPQWKNKSWVQLLPIRQWDELSLWLATLHYNIPINNKYTKGYQRVGCNIACPYYTASTWVLDKYWFPKGYERWHRMLDLDFERSEKWIRLNCTREEYHYNWNGGLVRKEPTLEVIREFAEYKGIESIETASQYFNKYCCECTSKDGSPRKIFHKDEIAMNLKLLGSNTDKFMCKKCLMKNFDMSKEKWDEIVNGFKLQGCKLF